MPEQDEAVAFAQALARRDVTEAARLAGSISYGIEVVDGAPGVGDVDGSRVLPAFVTFESWQRFGSTHEIQLLAPRRVRDGGQQPPGGRCAVRAQPRHALLRCLSPTC